ncbi:MAG TPA: AMP-binding protein, partial [Candidatus Polarisedimenticolia bacterium]|nr:AMP-binding protein [Candidatus Polarisedimenticolia bacterium]
MDPLALLEEAARRRPRGVAARCGPLAIGYADLRAHVSRIGRLMAEAGARPGDRVAALFPNCHLFLACYFGALERGFVLVPLNLRLSLLEIDAILKHSGARVLIGERALVGGVTEGETGVAGLAAAAPTVTDGVAVAPLRTSDGSADEPSPDGAAHLYYTSGTTGAAKGVILTRGNLAAHVEMTLEELGFHENDVWLHAAPMFHLADAWAVWSVTAAAGTHVFLPRFEAAAAFDLCAEAGVTVTNLVPTMLRGLLAEAERRDRRLPTLRLLLSGGAPIAPRTVAQVADRLGCEYVQTYGLTETSPFLTFSLLDEEMRRLPAEERLRYRARTGRPARGIELRVVRPAGVGRLEEVPADDATVGEVVVRGPTVSPGYWRNEAATREAFRDGWFHTGDLGTLDRRGSLNLVDRAKDVVITGGETVYSTEVEHVLYEHPAVREAAVFGVPDESWGEAVRAAVVPASPGGVAPGELIEFCRARIAHYKCPRAIDLLET